jgi:DNA polymerase-1
MNRKLTVGGQEYNGIFVSTMQEYFQLERDIQNAKTIVFDLETDGLYPYLGNRLTGAAFYFPDLLVDDAYYISFRHPDTPENMNTAWLRRLIPMLSDKKTIVTWNGKFDILMLAADDFPVLNRDYILEDVMIALHLLDENRWARGLNYKLKDVAQIFIAADAADEQAELKDELKKRGLDKGAIGSLPASLVADYAMMDVILTWKMREFLMPALERWHMVETYQEKNRYLQNAIIRMELNGMPIDREETARRIVTSDREAERLLGELQAMAGYPINPNSSQQVAAWLETPNARRKTLEARQEYDPRAALIIDYKFVAKASNTFYRPYMQWSAGDGKIHPSLNVTGTVTGRLSCSNPNLQQVPRKSKRYNVKEVFVAPPGYKIVQFDYKQLELRLACHFSGEPTMTPMFLNGVDMHQYTADALGVSRHIGKTSNFGLLYGMGHKKASALWNLSLSDAKYVVDNWRKLYPGFRRFHNKVIEVAKTWRDEDGNPTPVGQGWRYIRLMDGRCRHYLTDEGFFDSWNSLVQGTGAIICQRGITKVVDEWPDDLLVVPMLTVHDSFIALVHESVIKTVPHKIRQLMKDFHGFNVPLGVDIEYGDSWGTLHTYRGVDKWKQTEYTTLDYIVHPRGLRGFPNGFVWRKQQRSG